MSLSIYGWNDGYPLHSNNTFTSIRIPDVLRLETDNGWEIAVVDFLPGSKIELKVQPVAEGDDD